MKTKLIIDNQEIEVEISEEEYKKLQSKKKTGYERVNKGDTCFYVDETNHVEKEYDDNLSWSEATYKVANYYSDLTVAKNNARADKLMRQLRRFAVEHREKELDWNDDTHGKWRICYEPIGAHKYLGCCASYAVKFYGEIYFDSQETAQLACKTFHDELICYFTEYKDSL